MMNGKLNCVLLVSFVASVILCQQLSGQSHTGIAGVVRSVDGRPLDGTNVVVLGTAFGDATDEQGRFEIGALSAGTFKVEAALIGYKPAVRTAEVKPGFSASINFYLKPDTLSLEQVIVTAQRPETGLSQMTPHLQIITRADIANSNARTLSELLRQVSGVFIKSYGNSPAQQTISIRGGEANQVLVLIDGEAVTNPQTGQADLNSMALSNVERIEVLKGGASALFGSNAIAGVINIQTRSGGRPEGLEMSLQTMLAAFGTRQLGLHLAQQVGRFSYNLALDWQASDGDFEFVNSARVHRPVQKRRNADFHAYNAFARVKFDLFERSKLQLRTQLYDFETGTPGEISNPTPQARSRDQRYLTNASFTSNLGPKLRFFLSGFYDVFRNDFENPDQVSLDGSHETRSYGIEARQSLAFLPQSHLTLGAGFKQDEVSGTNIAGQPRRSNLSLFARGKLGFANESGVLFKSFALYPAIRVDRFSGLPAEVSPRLSFVLQEFLARDLKLVIDTGRSFRVPSFNSLFFISSVQVRSNPDLKPERAAEFDVGLHFESNDSALGEYSFSSTYFRRKVDGTIIWLPDFRFIWSPRNISKVIAQGVELSLAWGLPNERLKLDVNYTFTDSRFDLPGNRNPVPYRPGHVLNSEWTFKVAEFRLSFDQKWVSERLPNVAGTNAVPSYWLVDFTASRQVQVAGLELLPKLSLHNVFSENYAVVSNFPMPGREYRFSLTTSF